ncbi:MAG: hypothetical protein GY798_20585 [Hyphomicrobiales bacterium]|nr:hypothetical protein [Hyphomicrobiales bacterium]
MAAKFCADIDADPKPFPDDTQVDCLSDTHAIEVDWSDKRAEAIGQSLHYALWTEEIPAIGSKKPGIILVCRRQRDTCLDHIRRVRRVAQAYELPITLWDCDEGDEFLTDCQKQDL